MQSIVDASTVLYEPAGAKRAASPALSCASPLQHDSPCSCKRQRTLSMKIPGCSRVPVGALPLATPNMMTKTATPFNYTRDSNPGIGSPASVLNDSLKNSILSATDIVPQQQEISHCSKGHSRIHNFYTKASIVTPRIIVKFERAQVDERSLLNLLPLWIAMDLGLILYSHKILTIRIADHLIQTNQYCRFTIRVAGIDATINASVISGLQTILLGREWIQAVNLWSDFSNQSYYIPVLLSVEAAGEKFPNIDNGEAKTRDSRLVEMVTTDEIGGEDYVIKRGNVDCGDDSTSNNELSSNDKRLPDDGPSSDSELSSGEVSSNNQISIDDGLSGDKFLSDGNPSSNSEFSLNDLEDGEDENDESDECDEVNNDHEDYEDYGRKKCEECQGCEECEECEECEGCEGGEECEGCECEWCEDYRNCEECEGCEVCECEWYEDYEDCKECGGRQERQESARDDNFKGDLAFYMGSQQSQPMGERTFPSLHNTESQEQSATPSSAKSQTNEVQTPMTKPQAQGLANTLNQISQTPAGQSFKAPVEQLWPECADAYAAKTPNPIDLGTIEMKLKEDKYPSMDAFRADIILLYQNSVDFNGIDHIITSAALEVKKEIFKAISNMERGKDCTIASTKGL